MSESVPAYAQEAYAILRSRFASDSFPADYLSWFVSRSMVKKTLHKLEHAGWIRRVERGSYVCKNADEIFADRSEEHTSELQSRSDLVCRLLLEKKKKKKNQKKKKKKKKKKEKKNNK